MGAKAGAALLAAERLRDAATAAHWATMKVMVLAEVPATDAFVSLSRLSVDREAQTKSLMAWLVRLGADYQPAMKQLSSNAEAYAQQEEHELARSEQAALTSLSVVVAAEMTPIGPGNPYRMILPPPVPVPTSVDN